MSDESDGPILAQSPTQTLEPGRKKLDAAPAAILPPLCGTATAPESERADARGSCKAAPFVVEQQSR